MDFKANLKKFKNHLKNKGLFYTFMRGVKYCFFIFRKNFSRSRVEVTVARLPAKECISFSKGNIKLVYNKGTGFSIFWKDFELTQKPGFSCGIHTLGFSTNSSLADSDILEETKDSVKIKISFWELPISQIWSIRMGEKGVFFWDIDVEAREWLYIEEFRIVSLVGYGYKSWVSGHIQRDFQRVDDQWHDLFIGDRPFDLVAVRFPLGDRFRPSFSMELLGPQEYFSSIIQNPPLSHSAHIIGFVNLIHADKRQISPGFSRLFSGKIVISDTDNCLDARIEKQRQAILEKELKISKGTNAPGCSVKSSCDILLIQCSPWDVEAPPLSIAYLSANLKKYGYAVSVYDLNIELYNSVSNEFKDLWEQKSYNRWADDALFEETWGQISQDAIRLLKDVLAKINAPFVGLSVNYAGISFASRILPVIKESKKNAKLIVGGWGCIYESIRDQFPRELVDVFVVGEGEETLKEVLEVLKGERRPEDVPGAIFNKAYPEVYRPRAPIVDLDSIPWPTFAEFDIERYKNKVLPLFTSRGCIGRCSFCNDWSYLKPYRSRSPNHIFEEIKYHVEMNHVKVFTFKDLLCNGDVKKLNLLADLIIDSRLKIHWDSQAISHKEMDHGLLCKLRKAGCDTLIYGIESFSNNVLKGMKKIFTKEIAEKVLKDTSRAGIRTMVNIIVGFPGETEEDFQETLDAIRKNMPYISQICSINTCLVNPDTDLEDRQEDYNLALPLDGKTRARYWQGADGANTYDLRNSRAERVIELLDRIGLSYVYSSSRTK